MKKLLWIAVAISILFVAGCTKENKDNIEVAIQSSIEKYSPAMSQVPGIPLKPEFKDGKEIKDVKFHWITEQGVWLNWNKEKGEISNNGKEIINDGQQVYWSIDVNEKVEVPEFKIVLKVEDDSGKVLSEKIINIDSSTESFLDLINEWRGSICQKNRYKINMTKALKL